MSVDEEDGHGHGHVEEHDEHGDTVELDTLVLERREETGTHLQTDGENEQDEAELLDELERRRIDGHAQMAGQDAAEQHKRCPERDAEELDFAQQHADGNDDGIHDEGVCNGV